MIHVLAVITAKPGMRAQVLEHLQRNVAAVKAEAGCIEYTAVVDAVGELPMQTRYGDDTFLVIEKWASMDELNAHAAAPHVVAYAAKVKDLLAGKLVYVLQPA